MKNLFLVLLCAALCLNELFSQRSNSGSTENYPTNTVLKKADFLTSYEYTDTIIEAEDMVYQYASVQNNHPGYSGTGFIDGYYNTKQAYIEFTLAHQSETECIFGMVAAGNAPCLLFVNNVIADTLFIEGNCNWDEWRQTNSKPIYMPENINTIRIQGLTDKGIPNIDKINIDYQDLKVWKILANDENIYRTENFTPDFGCDCSFGPSFIEEDMLTVFFEGDNTQDFLLNAELLVFDIDKYNLHVMLNGEDITSLFAINDRIHRRTKLSKKFPIQDGLNKLQFTAEYVLIIDLCILGNTINPIPIKRYAMPNEIAFDAPSDSSAPWFMKSQDIVEPCNTNSITALGENAFDNGGYFDFETSGENTIDLTFFLLEKTNVDFEIKYSSPMAKQGILVNDKGKEMRTVYFQASKTENGWQSATSFLEYLDAGPHTIQLATADGSFLPVIDHINLNSKQTPILGINNTFCNDDLSSLSVVKSEGSNVSFYAKHQTPIAICVEYSNLSPENAEINCLYSKTIEPYQYKSFITFSSDELFSGDTSISVSGSNDQVVINSISVIGKDIEKLYGTNSWNITPDDEYICLKNFTSKNNIFNYSGKNDRLTAIFNNIESEVDIELNYNSYNNENPAILINGKDISSTFTYATSNNSEIVHAQVFMPSGIQTIEIESTNTDIYSLTMSGKDIAPIKTECYINSNYATEGSFYSNHDIDYIPFCNIDGNIIYSYSKPHTHNAYEYSFIDIDYGIGKGFEFNLFADKETDVEMQVRYAGENRPARLLVDSEEILPYVEFPSTGSWDIWDTVSIKFPLEKGASQIRLESLEHKGLSNIDNVRICSDDNIFKISCGSTDENILNYTTEGNILNWETPDSYGSFMYLIEYSNLKEKEVTSDIAINGINRYTETLDPNRYRSKKRSTFYTHYQTEINTLEIIPRDTAVVIHSISVVHEKAENTEALKSYSIRENTKEQTNNTSVYTYFKNSRHSIHVTYMSDKESAGTIELVSTEGIVIQSENIQIENGSNSFDIMVNDVAPGIYYVKTKTYAIQNTAMVYVE